MKRQYHRCDWVPADKQVSGWEIGQWAIFDSKGPLLSPITHCPYCGIEL